MSSDESITADRSEPRPYESLLAIIVPPWVADALCAQTDPDGFFPEKGGSTREAKAVCMKCTVSAECLDFALANEERFGIWGGLSERERRKLARLTNTTPIGETA